MEIIQGIRTTCDSDIEILDEGKALRHQWATFEALRGHFIVDYPKRKNYKKGTGGNSYDSDKYDNSTKGKPKTRFFRKALKDYRRENKK
ncbi:hypothetical protein GUJ93_ZPchr0009g1457 [Zizania palustris]|uniref:Uncharacterized protein n=1 Tax=Zizania palustris TaxID=103762 RepID=A0A8J5RLV2_ZIZPA|nr:hypothetical protein GUJ93_ZPchr0009g1457 [Zizania palustris]